MTNTAELARHIDHTLLKADARESEIERLCAEAHEHGFYSVCVNSCWVSLCQKLLAGSAVQVCAVVGFPLGAMSTLVKAFEASTAAKEGAGEVDMVMNIGFAKSGRWKEVEADIAAVVKAADCPVKVILETALLTDSEKRRACEASEKAGARFVKTSTGFSSGGATLEDVRLMKQIVGDRLKVKASGGIKSLTTMQALLDAGASRIGASGAVQFLCGDGSPSQGAY